MGCCASRPTTSSDHGPTSHAPITTTNNAADSSSRAAINQQPSESASIPNSTSRRPSSTRPNAPIRPPSPLPTSPINQATGKATPWTRSQLASEREAFFDTRVTGNPEAWNALKLVCECLRRGETAQAQGILDAVGLNVPDGRVAVGREERRSGRVKRTGGVWDERGEIYEVPKWVVVDPGDLVEDGPREGGEKGEEEKGKGKAAAGEGDLGDIVSLKARLSDRSLDVVVRIGMGQTAAVICEEVHKKIGPRRMRLMYLGQVWEESKTLEELGYKEGDVVSCFVFDE